MQNMPVEKLWQGKMQPSACVPFESSNTSFFDGGPLTVHLNIHLLEASIIKFMASWPCSPDTEKLRTQAAAQLKLECGQKASVSMTLVKATLPAAVLTSSASRPPNKRQALSPPADLRLP
jgi:hypothetical protein